MGTRLRRPDDRLGSRVAQLLQQPGPARERLTGGLYYEVRREDPVGLLELTLRRVLATEQIEKKIHKSMRINVDASNFESVISEAMHNGIINDIEARSLREAIELTHAAISVDAFDGKECLSRAPVRPERVTAT